MKKVVVKPKKQVDEKTPTTTTAPANTELVYDEKRAERLRKAHEQLAAIEALENKQEK